MDKATTTSIDTISKTCIAVRLRLLNRVVTSFYDDALRPLGLKVSQLNILIVTARLGLARPAQVCELLQLDVSTLSRNLKPLQAHGWLEVVPDKDARAQPFRLTAKGRRLIEKAILPGKRPSNRRVNCWGMKESACSPKPPRRWAWPIVDRCVFFQMQVAYAINEALS
jgi:DNA-binding MarR family transcriptional regulator